MNEVDGAEMYGREFAILGGVEILGSLGIFSRRLEGI